MASLRKRGKVWYYRYSDAEGIKHELKGCPDRRATEEMARAAESEAAKVRAGLIDPKELAYRRHGARPLAEHLAEFRAHLFAKGDGTKHAELFSSRGGRVVAMAGAVRLSDLTPSRVQAALADLRASGRSLATCNHHRAAIRGFTRWAWKDGRLRDDPLIGVARYNAKEDRRHDRRTLSLDELRRLIDAAHRGPTRGKMSGPDRALCYRLAVATGLRYSEIRSVTSGSFDLAGAHPTVTVAAGYTKNGDPATLPLPSDVADDLRSRVAGVPPDSPVFPLPREGVTMLKADLRAAAIPYRDDAGLVFDFHALRCQCATLADQAGVSPRVVQKLMRHSTLELTGRYTRPRMHDIEAATAALPTPRPSEEPSEVVATTGTDGQHISNDFAHHLPTEGDGTGRSVTDAGGIAPSSPEASMGRKPLGTGCADASGRSLAVPGVIGAGGIRTLTSQIKSPPCSRYTTTPRLVGLRGRV